MEKNLKIFLLVIAALIVFFILWGIIAYFSKGRRKGRAAEKKVASTLKKIGKDDKIRIINNAYLPLYNGTVEIDHIVFGNFGILVVETKGISGSLTGKGKKLVHRIGTKTHKLYNPLMQNKTHIDNVIHHLKKGGFSSIPVYGAVVFTDKELVRDADLGMSVDELKKFYSELKNAGCNQDALYSYFCGIEVSNPIKKYFHRFSKKDWD